MPDGTTVPRTCSAVLPPLKRRQTGPQSPEHVLQSCLLFREDRQDHSPQSMFYSSAPSSEKTDRTTVNRARSTVLPPLQRSKNTAVAPWSNAARTAVGQNVGLFEHINLHPNHFLKEPCSNAVEEKKKKKERKRPVFGIFNVRAGADAFNCARGLRTP